MFTKTGNFVEQQYAIWQFAIDFSINWNALHNLNNVCRYMYIVQEKIQRPFEE